VQPSDPGGNFAAATPVVASERFLPGQAINDCDRGRIGAPAAPRRPAVDGDLKTSAAWLIEQAGFGRGYGVGRVGLSTKHTLALVNRGGASTSELMDFARVIRAGVRDRFGITLDVEPALVGVTL